MRKNTGMTAEEEKAGKIPALPPEKAKAITQLLKKEAEATPPTPTVALVQHARDKKKQDQKPGNKIFMSH